MRQRKHCWPLTRIVSGTRECVESFCSLYVTVGRISRTGTKDSLLTACWMVLPERQLVRSRLPEIRDEIAGRYTKWLTLKGVTLDEGQSERLDTIISGIPDWNDNWASSIVIESGVTFTRIGTDETPDAILDLSDAEVVERAKADLGRDFRVLPINARLRDW